MGKKGQKTAVGTNEIVTGKTRNDQIQYFSELMATLPPLSAAVRGRAGGQMRISLYDCLPSQKVH